MEVTSHCVSQMGKKNCRVLPNGWTDANEQIMCQLSLCILGVKYYLGPS